MSLRTAAIGPYTPALAARVRGSGACREAAHLAANPAAHSAKLSPSRAVAVVRRLYPPGLGGSPTALRRLGASQSSPSGVAAAAGPAMSTTTLLDPSLVLDRVRGSLWGGLIGDALSMPVHWYYSVSDIKKDYGTITDYQAPKSRHPSSIMSVSNTGGHGRGGQSGRIIGDVINHGKHAFWGQANVHYHQGMRAGENTLNALCTRLVTRSIAQAGGYTVPTFLADYVKFMTSPGSHNDTYAESFHRDFFANYAAGVPPAKCAGKEGHNTAQIGGFVMLPPVIFSALTGGGAAVKARALEHLRTTHTSQKLELRASLYAEMVADVARGRDLREAVATAGRGINLDVAKLVGQGLPDTQVIGSVFSTACYIEDSFPSMLYLAYKYADSFEAAVLANTNVGGENCHRGAALGALMGAAHGESGIPARFISGLAATADVRHEIDAYCTAIVQPQLKEL